MDLDREKLILWLCEVDKNVGFIGAPWMIRPTEYRFKNAWNYDYEFQRIVPYFYFTIIILQCVYENSLKSNSLTLRNLKIT